MTKTITCILCPNGCDLTVDYTQDAVQSCTGNKCKNGLAFAQKEIFDPRRTITSSVLVTNGDRPLVSVRLTEPIPKDLIFPAMEQIKRIVLPAPVVPGTVIIRDILGTNSDLITTSTVHTQT